MSLEDKVRKEDVKFTPGPWSDFFVTFSMLQASYMLSNDSNATQKYLVKKLHTDFTLVKNEGIKRLRDFDLILIPLCWCKWTWRFQRCNEPCRPFIDIDRLRDVLDKLPFDFPERPPLPDPPPVLGVTPGLLELPDAVLDLNATFRMLEDVASIKDDKIKEAAGAKVLDIMEEALKRI